MNHPSPESSIAEKPPRVTVVIPAFNAARFLDETLNSIRGQSVSDLEILVVDDCSRDETAALIQRHAAEDPRVRYLRTAAPSGGPATPRNLGISQAGSEWIALCDADDLWRPRKLERQLGCALQTGADLVCSAIVDFPDGSPPPPEAGIGRGSTGTHSRVTLGAMLRKNRIPTSSVLCRRAVLVDAGGFDADRRLVAVEDYDLWLRILARGEVRVQKLEEACVAYRRMVGSLSNRKLDQARKVLLVLRRHFDRTGQWPGFRLAMPFLMLTYFGHSVWSRVIRGRL